MNAIRNSWMNVPALPFCLIEGWVPRAFAGSASAPGSPLLPLLVALAVVLLAGTRCLESGFVPLR